MDDLIEGFIRFMDLPRAEDGGPGFPGPINLGNPGEFTIRQLAKKVITLTGAKSKIVYRPLPADDPRFPFKERAHIPGSTTVPGLQSARDIAPCHVAFHRLESVGTRDDVNFAAHWLACACLCQRFARSSRNHDA